MDHLVTRAINAYLRGCKMRGLVGQIPSSSSAAEGGMVVLRNVNGELARYRVTATGHLRRVSPKPLN